MIHGVCDVYPSIARDAIISPMPSLTDVFGVAMLLIGLVALGGAVSLWIYLQNHFYMDQRKC